MSLAKEEKKLLAGQTAGLNFVWSFTASPQQSSAGSKVEGLVQASSHLGAISKIKRMGFIRPNVKINIEQTLSSGFGYIRFADFNLREKSRLFETLGKRLQRDGSMVTALESAYEYLQDGRLKAAVAILAAQIQDGNPVHNSMLVAGFSQRDAMVVRALSESGQIYKAFLDLAEEAKTRHQRNSALSAALRMPMFMVGGVFLALPAFFFGLGPRIAKFFSKLGSQNTNMPEGVKMIYGLVDLVNANTTMALAVWVAMGFGIVALWNAPIWSALAMRIKDFRDLSLKSEHASLWSVYGLMYSAGIPAQDICDVLLPTTQLKETGDALRKMSRRLAAGSEDSEAVQASGFPRFVVSGYRAAKDSGSVAEGLKSFTGMLAEDIELLTAQTKTWMQLLSMVLMAITVLGVFYIVYYPIAGPILNSL